MCAGWLPLSPISSCFCSPWFATLCYRCGYVALNLFLPLAACSAAKRIDCIRARVGSSLRSQGFYLHFGSHSLLQFLCLLPALVSCLLGFPSAARRIELLHQLECWCPPGAACPAVTRDEFAASITLLACMLLPACSQGLCVMLLLWFSRAILRLPTCEMLSAFLLPSSRFAFCSSLVRFPPPRFAFFYIRFITSTRAAGCLCPILAVCSLHAAKHTYFCPSRYTLSPACAPLV